ncbi:hypothetical protein ANN_14218 [Periplaneta americana]|uniref:HTH psq-type domain-containing protein n=1 Tax=Periplaneta americana TaxID=6978 RepID=A0ABQ8SVP9_PERAM|nr:hypothetical protein ANN_14218 [Periplaneta americana]
MIGKLPEAIQEGDLLDEEQLCRLALDRIQKKAETRMSNVKRYRHRWEPKVGDPVLLRDIKLSSALRGRYSRMELLYKGPFSITKNFGDHTYELKDLDKNKVLVSLKRDHLHRGTASCIGVPAELTDLDSVGDAAEEGESNHRDWRPRRPTHTHRPSLMAQPTCGVDQPSQHCAPQEVARLPAGLQLRSGVSSIPACADYLVGFFPRFSQAEGECQMVKCKRKTSNSWTENDMRKAIKAFHEGKSQRHAAELLGVPHSCLQQRLQSGQDNHLKSKGRQTTFTPEQENELVSRILKLYACGFGLHCNTVRWCRKENSVFLWKVVKLFIDIHPEKSLSPEPVLIGWVLNVLDKDVASSISAAIKASEETSLQREEEMILKDMLQDLNDRCEQYGMKIYANKTKSMVIGIKIQKINLRILNEAVEQVDSFKYLGCTISSNMSCCQEVKRRLAMPQGMNPDRDIKKGSDSETVSERMPLLQADEDMRHDLNKPME